MPRKLTCIRPDCQDTELTEVEIESSLTMRKLCCLKCGRSYFMPTKVGKVAQVAPLITAGVIVGSLLFGDLDEAVGHIADTLS